MKYIHSRNFSVIVMQGGEKRDHIEDWLFCLGLFYDERDNPDKKNVQLRPDVWVLYNTDGFFANCGFGC